jgi:CRP/FNR family transcriptional regulator, cyclic AMP receptor protein
MSDAERPPGAQAAREGEEVGPQIGPQIRIQERARLLWRYGRPFGAGEVLMREGTPAHETFLVHEGRVRLLRHVAMTDRSVAVLGAGDLFGEGALLEGATYGSTAVALSDGALLALDRATFRSLLGRDPEVAIRVVEQLARRLRDAEDKIEIMMLRGVQSKVAGTLLKLVSSGAEAPDLEAGTSRATVNISPVELSMRVGLDVDVVKRTMQRLRDRRYLSIVGERVEIADLEALRRLYALLGTKDELAGRSADT